MAKEFSANLILLDDPKARATASHMGLERIGTIGILQLALKQGILKDIKEDIDNPLIKLIYLVGTSPCGCPFFVAFTDRACPCKCRGTSLPEVLPLSWS
ncbi:hypothetical protein KKG56_11120 [bacterium]|nr:hypothetical protein [bacterium]